MKPRTLQEIYALATGPTKTEATIGSVKLDTAYQVEATVYGFEQPVNGVTVANAVLDLNLLAFGIKIDPKTSKDIMKEIRALTGSVPVKITITETSGDKAELGHFDLTGLLDPYEDQKVSNDVSVRFINVAGTIKVGSEASQVGSAAA
ncbi:MAG: hypothetical protein EXR81_01535 [Gammaproteobacteria bacterium]|nr:hypothetical protein [Gammaproteobacteria bacterium]